MVKPVNDRDKPAIDVDHDPGAVPDAPLSDDLLLDLLDALVDGQGRVPAARVLGVNYRTLSHCCDTRQVSRRMRLALVEFHAARGSVEAEEGIGDAPTNATWMLCGSGWLSWRVKMPTCGSWPMNGLATWRN